MGAITQAVLTVFKGRDEQSKVFNKMGRSSKRFGETSSKAFKKASRAAQGFGNITKGILGAQVIGKGMGLLSRGVQSVTTDFLGFDNAILSASAKFKGLDITTEKGRKTLEALKSSARKVGADTENNAAQAAQGLDFLALAGFNASQAMALLPGVTNLATVAQVDLATATDIASDSLGAFGLMTKNTDQLTKNFTRVQDVMAKTTATSNTNLTDLFEAVKKGAPDFTAAGQSIETFSTLIGAMANAGIKGGEAGTKLRNIAVRLTGGSKAAAIAIEDLGIRVADGSGNFRDMLDIIDDVIKGTAKMGSVQRASTLKVIFGARQTGGLNVILKEGTEQLRSYRQMLIDSTGAAEKMAKIMRSSLLNRLKSLGSALTEVGFQLFSAFDTQGASAIETITGAIRKVDMTPVINAFKKAGEVVGIVWKFLKDTGVIDVATKAFDVMLKAVGPIGKAFQLMWRALKPIMRGFKAVLMPVMEGLGVILDAIGVTLDALDKKLAKTIARQDQFKKANVAFSQFRQQERGTAAFKKERPGRFSPEQLGGRESDRKFFGQAQKDIERFTSAGLLPALIGQIAPEFAQQRGEALREREKPTVVPQQNVNVGGKFTFENAPKGSKFEQDTGTAPIDVNMTGASPAEL